MKIILKVYTPLSIVQACRWIDKTPVAPFRQVTGDDFCCPQFPTESTRLSIFHTDFARTCPQVCMHVRFARRQVFCMLKNFVRVSCGYFHADVIAKHQQETLKGRNLFVYNPLKEMRLKVGRGPVAISHQGVSLAFILRAFYGQGLYTASFCVRSFLRAWGGVYEDIEDKLLPSCW